MSKSISIAIMSDMHCHRMDSQDPHESYFLADMPERPSKQHPIESLIELIKAEQITANLLLVPGDLANRCDRSGFGAAWEYANKVKRLLKANHILGTVGNHDVDSHNKCSANITDVARNQRADFPVVNKSAREKFWSCGYYFKELSDVRIVVINSVTRHTEKDEVKRGKITDTMLESLQADLISKKSKPIQLAMVHHHPLQHEELGLGSEDLMINGDNLLSLLEQYGFKLLIHGHKHHPNLRYASGTSNSMVVFASGSVSAISNKNILSRRIQRPIATIVQNVHGAYPSLKLYEAYH